MTCRTLSTVLVVVLLTTLICSSMQAEPFSDNGEHDIGALLDQARQLYDFEAEDAVILLQQERRLWTADGRRIHELHRIVWIRTSRGIRGYADLRVPWDRSRQTLTATTLRSWRPKDERWTASGPTAVVETTPYAFSHAVDYTNMRETMLLHDGVELPCILETRYIIADQEAFADGMEGVHTMARRDPTLISELVLGASPEDGLVIAADGVEPAEESTNETGDLHLWTFRSQALGPLPHPHPAATEVAHVAWSTWGDNEALGNELSSRLDAAAKLDEGSIAAAEKAAEEARSPIETAENLAAWVADSTAFVAYDSQWFTEPRRAHQTWSTAYAHVLDRTVLAAAVFRDAGFQAGLAYRRPLGVGLSAKVATLSSLEGPLLWVSGEGFEGIYDPVDSSLAVGAPALSDGSLWRLGNEPETGTAPITNSAELRLDISWNAESAEWEGTGLLRADDALSPFARMQGLEAGRSHSVLEALAGAVVDGAKVGALNFERFVPEAVHAGFALTVRAGDRDPQDRIRIEIGDPAPSLNDPMHAAGPLYETARESTAYVDAPLEIVVELHIDITDLEVIAMPESIEITNDIGSFQLVVGQGEDGISIRRRLFIESSEINNDEWPQLRALLLANASLRNRTLILR